MFRAGARGVILALAVLGLVTASAGAMPQESVVSPELEDPAVESLTATPQNNSTTSVTQQENPDSVGEDGDREALENWLGDRLASRLGESVIQISEGQYEDAQGLLGDEYNDQLSKYVDVAGDTDSGDDSTAEERREQFNETAEAQSEYAETASEFQETYEAYLAEKKAGDEERARRLARKLLTLSSTTERLNGTLQANLQNISVITGVSLSDERQALANQTENITNQTQIVIAEAFTATTVMARANSSGSFVDPIEISGRVTTNDSRPLNGTVLVHIHDDVVSGSVRDNGTFTVEYQPKTVPTGAVDVRVRFVPEPTSTHLGSNTTVQTNITSVQPSLRIENSTTEARYGDAVRTTGRVTVDGHPIENADVTLLLDGARFATAQTDASGRYTLAQTLPARVSPREHTLTVRVGDSGTAIAPNSSTEPVRVEETATSMTLTASASGDDIQVSGRLQTADGVGVGGQTITLRRNGSIVQSVSTNGSGHFTATIVPPKTVEGNASIQIGAIFDGSGTNLETAREQTTVTTSFGSAGTGDSNWTEIVGSSDSLPFWVGAIGAIAVLLVGGYVLYRSKYQSGTTVTDDTESTLDSPPAGEAASEQTSNGEPNWQERLAVVQSYLEDNDSEHAVRALYGAVRAAYTLPGDTAKTHWEFYTAVSDELEADSQATLRELTEVYETVQFGDLTPDSSEVESLLSAAQSLIEPDAQDRNQHPASAESDD